MIELYQPQLQSLILEMFKIFEPKSQGNFHHFHKILGRFMSRAPTQTAPILVQNDLIWKLFGFCHEPSVADAIMDCVCSSFPKHTDGISHFKSLVEANIHEKIGKFLTESNPVSLNVSDTYIRVLEKLSSQELSGVLFLNLCKTSNFLDGLFEVISAPDADFSASQKQGCVNMIKELLLRSQERAVVQHAFARPIPNMLLAINAKLHEHARGRVESICKVIVDRDTEGWGTPSLELATFTVRRPLGLYLFNLLEILCDLIVSNHESINQVTPRAWQVLSNWFLEYSNNNLLQGLFFKIFRVVMNPKFTEAQKLLLQGKNKFLTKMIEQYNSPTHKPSRGYILLICNLLRLTSNLPPEKCGFIKLYLKSHDMWQGFLPTLRADTIKQNTPFTDLEEDGRDSSIDLGSCFARSLGINDEAPKTVAPPKSRKPKKKKSKSQTNASESSSESSADESATEDSTEDSEKTPEVPEKPQEISQKTPEEVQENSEQVEEKVEEISQAPSWWSDLTAEIESQEDKKEEAEKDDWWSDLKQSLDEVDH